MELPELFYWIKKKAVDRRSPTIIIAASDAPEEFKKKADYICDGINDHVEIQEAINSISRGTVLLSPGTFVVSDEIYMKSGVIIAGSGKTATIVKGAHSGVGTAIFYYPEGTSDTELRDMTIDGDGKTYAPVFIRASSTKKSYRNNIINCRVINSGGGAEIKSDAYVYDGILMNSYISGNYIGVAGGYWFIVANNYFRTNSAHNFFANANIVYGNSFNAGTNVNILVEINSSDLIVANNRFNGNVTTALFQWLYGAERLVFTNNILSGSAFNYGLIEINGSNAIIANNVINSSNKAIGFLKSGGSCDNIWIVNNYIKGELYFYDTVDSLYFIGNYMETTSSLKCTYAYLANNKIVGSLDTSNVGTLEGDMFKLSSVSQNRTVQYGVVTGIPLNVSGEQIVTVTFPEAFSATPDSITATIANPTVTDFDAVVYIKNASTAGFDLVVNVITPSATAGSADVFWMAVGPK